MRTLKRLAVGFSRIYGKGGFTLVELMVVVGIFGIILALAIPNFINARRRAQATTCINNMKLLYEAGQAYRLEQGSGVTDINATTLYNQGYTEEVLDCPTGGAYAGWDADTHPVCSVGTNSSSYTWDDHVYP